MVRLLSLLLVLVLLTGCGWMDGSYVSVTPHQVGIQQSAEVDIRSVASYTELRSALVALVDGGRTEGLFSLAEYPRDAVPGDMERAVEYVQERYPLGAYAVDAIRYNFGTGLGGSALSVDIRYRPGAQSLDRIRTVRWMSGAEAAIQDALDECAEGVVLQVTGYHDVDFPQLVKEYARDNPDRVMEAPAITLGVYPDSGDTRVVELQFIYRTDRERLRAMREQVQPVFSSAALYVSGEADAQTKFSQLHSFLMERFDYKIEDSVTPAYSLLCQGTGDDRAFALVYAAMCSRIGLKARCIQGSRNGEEHWWNQISIDGEWYHVDLLSSRRFSPLRDEQMDGYHWDG